MDASDLARGPAEIWQWSKEQLMIVLPPMVKISAVRPGSSVASTMIPLYPGSVARTHDRVQAL
ncbi:hypothetical protein LguiB_006195 [Lonicera macranthoides]